MWAPKLSIQCLSAPLNPHYMSLLVPLWWFWPTPSPPIPSMYNPSSLSSTGFSDHSPVCGYAFLHLLLSVIEWRLFDDSSGGHQSDYNRQSVHAAYPLMLEVFIWGHSYRFIGVSLTPSFYLMLKCGPQLRHLLHYPSALFCSLTWSCMFQSPAHQEGLLHTLPREIKCVPLWVLLVT